VQSNLLNCRRSGAGQLDQERVTSVPQRSDSVRESNSLKETIMGILRDRMIEEMKLRNLSPATPKS
jgi:hypothetical protein